jgi:elongation factor 1-beta
MGNAAVVLRVMPESPETDLKKISEEVNRLFKPKEIRESPIGFGLKALEFAVIVPDAQGQTEMVVEKLSRIPGVADVQIVGVTLI